MPPRPAHVVGEIIDDPLLVEMLFCPILFYGGAPRARHRLRPVQHPVPLDFPGRARPAAGRHPADPEDAGARSSRSSAANCGCGRASSGSSSTTTPSRRSSSRTAAKSTPATCSRRPAGPRRCGCATSRRRPIGQPAGCRSSSRSRSSTRQPRTLGIRQDDRLLQRFGQVPLREARRPGRPAQRHDLLARTISPTPTDSAENHAHLVPGELRPLGALAAEAYRLAKLRWYDRMAASAVRFVPDFRHRVVDTDLFTPLTIHRFTGHDGALQITISLYKR